MKLAKKAKDQMLKFMTGHDYVPRGLYDLGSYFRNNAPIHFEFKQEDGMWVAVSTNFRQGSIVTYGKNREELDRNIKDAILTAFEIPSSYAKEAQIYRTDEQQMEYALA